MVLWSKSHTRIFLSLLHVTRNRPSQAKVRSLTKSLWWYMVCCRSPARRHQIRMVPKPEVTRVEQSCEKQALVTVDRCWKRYRYLPESTCMTRTEPSVLPATANWLSGLKTAHELLDIMLSAFSGLNLDSPVSTSNVIGNSKNVVNTWNNEKRLHNIKYKILRI